MSEYKYCGRCGYYKGEDFVIECPNCGSHWWSREPKKEK